MAAFDPQQDGTQNPAYQNSNIQYDDQLYHNQPTVVNEILKDELPTGCTKVFKLQWYQQFFDNTSGEIARRVLQSILIFKGNFIVDANTEKPDLWYPIWIVITMIFTCFFTQIITQLAGGLNLAFSQNMAVFSALILGYTIVVPTILFFVCWCIDMEGMSYPVIVDLITYSYTILVPITVIYPVFTLLVTSVSWLRYLAIGVFSFSAFWSFLFVTYHGLIYVKNFSGTKCQILAIQLTLILAHAAFLVGLGCLIFIYNGN